MIALRADLSIHLPLTKWLPLLPLILPLRNGTRLNTLQAISCWRLGSSSIPIVRPQCVLTCLLLIGSAMACLTGCSTHRLLQQQQLALLTSEVQYMNTTEALLEATPDPQSQSDMSAFVSQATLNKVLMGADNHSAPLGSLKGVLLTLHSVRLHLGDGYPGIDVDATAEKAVINASLRMQISAVLEPSLVGNRLYLKLAVRQVIPDVHWTIFQFRLRGFIHDLIQVKLDDYAKALPNFTIPLTESFSVSNLQRQLPLNLRTSQGQVDGVINLPPYQASIMLQTKSMLVLRDGIHIYFKTAASIP